MQVKTFKGSSMNEVLRQVKAEFGEDAIIVSSRQGGAEGASALLGKRVIEVTAAQPAQPRPARTQPAQVRPALNGSAGSRSVSFRPAAEEVAERKGSVTRRPDNDTATLDHGNLELLRLKEDLREMRHTLQDVSRNIRFEKTAWGNGRSGEAFENLQLAGLGKTSAGVIVEEAGENMASLGGDFARSLKASIARRLRCAGKPENRRAGRPLVLALVGPTGAGKTSAIARMLTSPQAFAGRKVGVLSLDTRKIAALDQLKSLSRILRFPLAAAWRAEEVRQAMDQLGKCEVLLVDTPGIHPARKIELDALRLRLDAVDPQEIHIVQHGGLRLAEQLRFCEGCRELGAGRMLVTHLDECGAPGGLLDLCEGSGLALSWLGTGASVQDALRLARPDELADWILEPARMDALHEEVPA